MDNARLSEIKCITEKAAIGNWLYNDETNEVTCGEYVIARDIDYKEDAQFIAMSRQAVPEFLAEVERLKAKLSEAESLLGDASSLLDDVHCYETDVYEAITKYFYGDDADE